MAPTIEDLRAASRYAPIALVEIERFNALLEAVGDDPEWRLAISRILDPRLMVYVSPWPKLPGHYGVLIGDYEATVQLPVDTTDDQVVQVTDMICSCGAPACEYRVALYLERPFGLRTESTP